MVNIITQDYLKSILIYDMETGIFTRAISRNSKHKAGDVAGKVETTGYVRIKIDGKLYAAHRLAWLFVTGKFPNNQIDHINGNRKDNRFNNLREATNQQNAFNKVVPKNNTSGLKGVSWHKLTGKWQACYRVNNQRKHIGIFERKEDAEAAYIINTKIAFGEFYREA